MTEILAFLQAHKAQIYTWLAICFWWVLATGLANLTAHKSQIDAWCEKRPRLAGALKILRGIGFDPWLVIQGVSLLVTQRLPSYLRNLLPILLVAVAVLLVGCSGSFEASRRQLSWSRQLRAETGQSTIRDSPRCESLDAQHRWWGGAEVAGAALTGATGIAAYPADTATERKAIAGTAIALGAVTLLAHFEDSAATDAWVRECSQ